VVAGVDGPETNTYWKRLDDGSRPGFAEIEAVGEEIIGPGHALAMLSTAIHSVENRTARVTLSLHTYGRHLNHTNLTEFDPERRVVRPVVRKTR
jgi:hypothetical protein